MSRNLRRHPAVRALVGTGLALAAGAEIGLRPPQVWSGLRWGAAGAGAIAAGVAVTTVHPRVRAAMIDRDLPGRVLRWLAFEIPLGTVWAEETVFRGAVGTAATSAFGPRAGRALQATAFGIFHVANARETGEPVLGTVVVTGAAGWVFGWLAQRSGSLVAPVLTHLAVNEAGAVAALLIRRRR